MKDRSDNPLHHEQTLLPQSYNSLLADKRYIKICIRIMTLLQFVNDEPFPFLSWTVWPCCPWTHWPPARCQGDRLDWPQTRHVHLHLEQEGRKEMFYLTAHSTHFIYGYMASDIWSRTTQIVREETRCRHMGYSFRLTARVLLYPPSHRQDSTYHGLCYTSRGALAGTRMNEWMNEWLTTPQHKDYIGCWGVKQKVFIVKVKYNNDILKIHETP